ncbi:hypothetical protein L1887_07586 [Cichorium endivia]|nr:hypothetical protein L1887_07586 [Cichorium endivia]
MEDEEEEQWHQFYHLYYCPKVIPPLYHSQRRSPPLPPSSITFAPPTFSLNLKRRRLLTGLRHRRLPFSLSREHSSKINTHLNIAGFYFSVLSTRRRRRLLLLRPLNRRRLYFSETFKTHKSMDLFKFKSNDRVKVISGEHEGTTRIYLQFIFYLSVLYLKKVFNNRVGIKLVLVVVPEDQALCGDSGGEKSKLSFGSGGGGDGAKHLIKSPLDFSPPLSPVTKLDKA